MVVTCGECRKSHKLLTGHPLPEAGVQRAMDTYVRRRNLLQEPLGSHVGNPREESKLTQVKGQREGSEETGPWDCGMLKDSSKSTVLKSHWGILYSEVTVPICIAKTFYL